MSHSQSTKRPVGNGLHWVRVTPLGNLAVEKAGFVVRHDVLQYQLVGAALDNARWWNLGEVHTDLGLLQLHRARKERGQERSPVRRSSR
jgi:hypothetical protein